MKTSILVPLLALAAGLAGVGWWYGAGRLDRAADADRWASAAPVAPAAYERPAAEAGAEPDSAFPRAAPGGPGAVAGGVEPLESNEEAFVELNRQSIEALEAGEHDAAIAGFEACLEALPGEAVLAANLAEALARKAVRDHEYARPCAHCPELLERAIELAPGRADLAELRERWAQEAEAEEGFWRESSQHFDLAYDGSRDELLWGSHRLLELLEASYGELGLFFGYYPVEAGRPRFPVALYRRERFDELTGLGDWAGGAFDGTVRVPVGDFQLEEARLRTVLHHELVHAFVREVGGTGVPDWLNEGLAQWLEPNRAAALAAARERLAGHALYPLDRIEGSIAHWQDAEAIARAYAQSLALVDHLARQHGERLLVELVEGCGAGASAEGTFLELTRVSLDVVLGDLADGLAR